MELSQKITSKSLYEAFDLMSQKKLEEAEALLESGLKEAEAAKDRVMTAIYFSAFGVLCKLRKEFRKAWKYYEKAEKLIPEDPALKLISARLLVDYFGQYDTVIKKMEKLAQAQKDNRLITYQANTLRGTAYLRKGDKKKALACLTESMADDFKSLETAANFDFKLVEEMIKKGLELALCRSYLEKAHAFTQKSGEAVYEKVIHKILSLLPAEKS